MTFAPKIIKIGGQAIVLENPMSPQRREEVHLRIVRNGFCHHSAAHPGPFHNDPTEECVHY